MCLVLAPGCAGATEARKEIRMTLDRNRVTNPVDLVMAREREMPRWIEKLNLRSTADLVRFAIRDGFIS